MANYNASMARQGIRLICEHFGADSSYLAVQRIYIDLCDTIAESAVLHGNVDVNEIIVRAFHKAWDELHPPLFPHVEEP